MAVKIDKEFIDSLRVVGAAGKDEIVRLVFNDGQVKYLDLKSLKMTDEGYSQEPAIWEKLKKAAGDKPLRDDALLHYEASENTKTVNYQKNFNINNGVVFPVNCKDGTRITYPALYAIAFSAYVQSAADGIKIFDEELFIDEDCASDMVSAYKTFNSLILGHDLDDTKQFAQLFKEKTDNAGTSAEEKNREEREIDDILSSLK